MIIIGNYVDVGTVLYLGQIKSLLYATIVAEK